VNQVNSLIQRLGGDSDKEILAAINKLLTCRVKGGDKA